MELDAKLLYENLRKIPEEENEISERGKKMKRLLCILLETRELFRIYPWMI